MVITVKIDDYILTHIHTCTQRCIYAYIVYCINISCLYNALFAYIKRVI